MRFLGYYLLVLVALAMASLAYAQDVPKLRFIPICESLAPDAGDVDCIPQASVNSQQNLIFWRFASFQLGRCERVVLDPSKPYSYLNLGYRCHGTLTATGLIPDEDAEP